MDDFALVVLYGAFGLFTVLCLTAVAFDIWKMIIPNAVSVLLVALFFATALTLNLHQGFPVSWLSHLGAMASVFAGGLLCYRFKVLGAGDVKLLTATSLWAGFDHLLEYLFIVALAGGGLALALLLLRNLVTGLLLYHSALQSLTLPRILLTKEHIPYGVAIALPAIYLATKLPILGGYLF